MPYSPRSLLELVLSLILVSILLPIGVIYIASVGDSAVVINGTTVAWTDVVDPAITTLLATVLPLVVCIGIITAFIYGARQG
ncbi:MAG: hypothetical protein ACFFDH_24850 [Promethearchaeota archaeon]